MSGGALAELDAAARLRVRIAGLVAALAAAVLVALAGASLRQPLFDLEELAQGKTASEHADPAGALAHFEAALSMDPRNYEANWRAASALVDIGKQTPDSVKSRARDSLYARAESLAKVAVEADSTGADRHYILAAAIGRASLTKSKKERVRRAAIIRSEALKAIEIDPNHDKAYHVLGRWHAEIKRLSGLTRFFAKTFLGAGIFNEASWEKATEYMEKAVALAPDDIYHRLDLAEVYIDRDRWADAREQLQKVLELPVYDVSDPQHKERAAFLLEKIKNKK